MKPPAALKKSLEGWFAGAARAAGIAGFLGIYGRPARRKVAGTEVLRRVAVIKSLASGEETGIRIAGIVDRDYKSTSEVAALRQAGVFEPADGVSDSQVAENAVQSSRLRVV